MRSWPWGHAGSQGLVASPWAARARPAGLAGIPSLLRVALEFETRSCFKSGVLTRHQGHPTGASVHCQLTGQGANTVAAPHPIMGSPR